VREKENENEERERFEIERLFGPQNMYHWPSAGSILHFLIILSLYALIAALRRSAKYSG
jgi:hypothetical protein